MSKALDTHKKNSLIFHQQLPVNMTTLGLLSKLFVHKSYEKEKDMSRISFASEQYHFYLIMIRRYFLYINENEAAVLYFVH